MMRKIYFFTFLIISSCNIGGNGCPYIDGISTYFENEHKIKIFENLNDNLYFILDLQGCEACVFLNTKMLKELEKNENLTIVLVGETNNYELENRITLLKQKFKHILDEQQNIFSYQTNLSSPLLIHIKEGNCYNIITVNDLEINNVKNYINNFSK